MKISTRIINKAVAISRKFYIPAEIKEVQRWIKDNGDNTLRLNYELNQDSIVFDVGGYKGEWAEKIFSKYGCNIYVFEPIPSFADDLEKKFSQNPKIHTNKFGLGKENKTISMSLNNDGSSMFKRGSQNNTDVEIVDVLDFIKQNEIKNIELIKINIEGGEYDLLECLVNSDFIKNVKNIQVQFHSFAPGAKSRMEAIQNKLANSHELTYQYKFVWENWKLK